jgi:hypothetical protein
VNNSTINFEGLTDGGVRGTNDIKGIEIDFVAC